MCPFLAEPMSRSELASVPVSKLGKTDLVFVQPGAKIKCLLLSEHTRTRFTLGNSPYLESWTTTSYSSRMERLRTVHIAALQCAWVHWTRNLAAEQSGSKSHGLFSVWGVAASGVSSQNFRHWSAETSSDWLLGSARPGHRSPLSLINL